MAALMLHAAGFGMFWVGARNRVYFRVKWLQAAMKGTVFPVCGVCGLDRFEVNRLSLGIL